MFVLLLKFRLRGHIWPEEVGEDLPRQRLAVSLL